MKKVTATVLRERQSAAENVDRLMRTADHYESKGETDIADLYRHLAGMTRDRDHWKAVAEIYERQLLNINLEVAKIQMAVPPVILSTEPACNS